MRKPILNIGINKEGTKSLWLRMQVDKEWTAAYRVLIEDGWPVIGEVRIFPTEPSGVEEWSAGKLGLRAKAPAGGITASVIRGVRLGVVRGEVSRILEYVRAHHPSLLEATEVSLRPKEVREKKAAGRPPLSDIQYARLAAYYVGRCERDSHSPIVDTAQHFKIPTEKARAQLHQARVRGLLTHPTQGAARGVLTEKAKEALKSRSRKGV